MINPILFLSALWPDMIDNDISKLDKCNLTWKIKDIKIIKNSECLDNVEIMISWSNWYYNVNVSKTTDTDCSHDSIYLLYWNKNIPKIWDKVDYMIDKSSYHIISDNKVWEWIYKLVSWNNSELNTEICTPNSSFVEQNSNYLYYWILICTLIIIWIIVNILLKKKKSIV